MKKIFISIPITNKENTVQERLNDAIDSIKNSDDLKEYEIVTPYGIDNYTSEGMIKELSPEEDVAFFMGKDIELLLRCNAIYSCDGWRNSRGCRAERMVAYQYGLELCGKAQ